MRNWFVVIAFIPLLFTGCSSTKVKVYDSQDLEMSSFHTYSWASSATDADDGDKYRVADASIRSSVDRALVSKGYHQVAKQTPDFQVDWRIALSDQNIGPQGYFPIGQVADGDRSSQRAALDTFRSGMPEQLKKHSIILIFSDPKLKKPVYAIQMSQFEKEEYGNLNDLRTDIEDAINKGMRSLPRSKQP